MRPSQRTATSLLIAAALALPAAAAPPTVADVREALDAGKTERAARLAAEALNADPGADLAELRYLRLKAYVLDLAPGNEQIFERTTKDVSRKKKQEYYDLIVDGLEGDVRATGAAALPVLVEHLSTGDTLDRLLSLGLLNDLSAGTEALAWSAPAGAAGASPVEAARIATLGALEECAATEDDLGVRPAYAIENQLEREPYLESILTALTGLEFLATVDPASWGTAAAFALECRGTAGAVMEERAMQREYAAELRPPALERATASSRVPARLDAIELLGRIGECADRVELRQLTGGEIGEAARLAVERIGKRGGCPDS